MKRSLIFVFLLGAKAFASELPEWQTGVIVLENQNVLTGELAVEQFHDVVLYRKDGQVTVFPAYKISSVYYYDATQNINRRYITHRLTEKGLTISHLYEVVAAGNINVIRRLKSPLLSVTSDVQDFNYYTLSNDKFYLLQQFRDTIYPTIIQNCQTDTERFMDENRLNPNRSADAIRIILFYNRNSCSKEVSLVQR